MERRATSACRRASKRTSAVKRVPLTGVPPANVPGPCVARNTLWDPSMELGGPRLNPEDRHRTDF
jgi:hypothetical protein